MDATEGAAVLARARQGDSEAFRALVERHSRSVFRLAFRMTGNEHDAEDVVQESFLRAYRQLGRFEARANFGTWLYPMVANCAVDMLRANQAQRLPGRQEAARRPRAVAHRRSSNAKNKHPGNRHLNMAHYSEDDL